MKFLLGRILATPGALVLLDFHGVNPADLLERHVKGDWGDLDAEDKATNDLAVTSGDRILSVYKVGPGKDDRVWIITEYDRSVTTILRPDEY